MQPRLALSGDAQPGECDCGSIGTGQVLRVDATGATEHMHNHAETMLKFSSSEVTDQQRLVYRVSFRARWISGSNLLNSRLYFNRIARTSALPVASGGGTPGAANSTAVANLGPTFTGLIHSPSSSSRWDSCDRQCERSGSGRLGNGKPFLFDQWRRICIAAMTNQGSGRYTGTIPAQTGGTKVQFYVQATDHTGSHWHGPALGTASRAWCSGKMGRRA
jgi:hypothetical protein